MFIGSEQRAYNAFVDGAIEQGNIALDATPNDLRHIFGVDNMRAVLNAATPPRVRKDRVWLPFFQRKKDDLVIMPVSPQTMESGTSRLIPPRLVYWEPLATSAIYVARYAHSFSPPELADDLAGIRAQLPARAEAQGLRSDTTVGQTAWAQTNTRLSNVSTKNTRVFARTRPWLFLQDGTASHPSMLGAYVAHELVHVLGLYENPQAQRSALYIATEELAAYCLESHIRKGRDLHRGLAGQVEDARSAILDSGQRSAAEVLRPAFVPNAAMYMKMIEHGIAA